MFSFKPGLSYIAMSIAIWITTIIIYVILGAIFGMVLVSDTMESGTESKSAIPGIGSIVGDIGGAGIGVMLASFVLSFIIIFAVSDWIMPPLCNWVDEDKKHSKAASSAAAA